MNTLFVDRFIRPSYIVIAVIIVTLLQLTSIWKSFLTTREFRETKERQEALELRLNSEKALLSKITELERKLVDTEQSMRALEAENIRVISSNSDLTAKRDELNGQVTELKTKVSKLEIEESSLASKKRELTEEISSLGTQRADLIAEVSSHKNKLDGVNQDYQKANEKLSGLEDKIRITKESLGSLTNSEAELRNTITKEEKRGTELGESNAALSAAIEAQKQVLDQFKVLISKSTSEIEKVFVLKQTDIQSKMEAFLKDLNMHSELIKTKLNEDGARRDSLAEADLQARGSLEKLRQVSQSTADELLQVRKMVLELKEKSLVPDRNNSVAGVPLKKKSDALDSKAEGIPDLTSVPNVGEIKPTASNQQESNKPSK